MFLTRTKRSNRRSLAPLNSRRSAAPHNAWAVNRNAYDYMGRRFKKKVPPYGTATTDGRWTKRDPLGEITGLNIYDFIHNKPSIHTDYTGLFIDTIWDVGNMIWDDGVIVAGAITGDTEMMKEGATDLLPDTAAAAIPGVPAGASKAARAAQKASRQAAKAAEKKALKKRLKRIAECEIIYSEYKVYHCKKCTKCSTCAEIGERIACWTAFSAGRKLYLDKKCDYYLEGSIRVGSRKQEGAHKEEYAKAAMSLAKCTSFLKDCR